MLANELIDRLERLGLLDQEIIEALRQQLAAGGARVTPEAVAKLLVDNGQLTHFQASKLIGELRSGEYTQDSNGEALMDDLGFAEDDPGDAVEAVDVVEVEPVQEVVAVAPVEPIVTVDAIDDQPPVPRPAPSRPKPDPQKSVWDSFKVYGYLGIIAMLLLIGGGIGWVLTREGADEVIKHANELYDQQNYEVAQKAYQDFAEDYPDSQYRSKAVVRVVMTELYKARDFRQEPWRAVDLAKEKLPTIANEQGMNEDRGNLAQLLVDIAANLASAAGKSQETASKQSILQKLDQHRELMNEPLYMTATMRANLANQIQAVDEARARVQRDINRNVQLDESEAAMQSLLDDQQTKAAYDVRKKLLREFPELKDHQRMVTLIRRASDIQQTLVKPSTKRAKTLSEASPSKSLSSIVLTTLVGNPAPDLRGEILYLRAGGSILAFDGESGKLKWRRFVGYAKDMPPVRLAGDEGVLLSDSSTLEVIRCGSEDGGIVWRAAIEESFSLPVSTGDDVYVASESGRLNLLDAETGDAKWATQIPQPLETGPGIDRRTKRAYLPGNHSNIYVLNTTDGSCLESFYVGHDEGTIMVPPVPLMGHLFVIENAGADYANVHVLRVDETGNQLKVAQPPFRLTGNVRINPIIQGRRLIVLTDRGEGVVYDVEPTAEREQVTVAATLSPSYNKPTSTQMAVSGTQMWITGTRIGRYELQINTGNIISDWTLHDADTFIGQPFAIDDTLVHARVLRGTSAIRVTAADAKSGKEIWHTDAGVPIAMIRQAPGGRDVHVVTSQAALYQLDRQSLASGSTDGPVENPGDRIVAKSYSDPISLNNNRAVMLNKVDGKSMLVYDPTRERELLRSVTMSLSAGRPSAGGLAVNDGILVPLDIGRVEWIDFRTGASKATPFQPEADPTGKVAWTTPVAVSDDPDQVILANNRKKIYRLRVAEQIRELASKDLEYELLGPAAGVGGTWFAATGGPSADFLVGLEMASMNEKFKTLLDGRIVWGPAAVEGLCLVQTDDMKLHAFDPAGQQLFSVALPPGQPVGKPTVVNDSIVLAGKSGWVVSIDPSAGQVTGKTDLMQPISAAPFPIGTSLLVPGKEGVIYIVKVPGE
jgi:outer membrane protein assembly factor BamB